MTTSLTPCPTWCTLEPGHDWDGTLTDHRGGRAVREHQGPTFGDYVSCHATEYDSQPGVLLYGATVIDADSDELNPYDLRQLAAHCAAAAEWLEANR